MPNLGIVTINWNSIELLKTCLSAVAHSNLNCIEKLEVVIVDNKSDTFDSDSLPKELPLRIIRNQENLGFAAACNLAIKELSSDYVLFLNPDTEVFEDTICESLKFMETKDNLKYGILGVQLIDSTENPARSCCRFPTPISMLSNSLGLDRFFKSSLFSYSMLEFAHTESREVDHVIGAYYLVRNDLLKKLNGFRTEYFMYFEDIDFSKRASQIGYKTYFLASTNCFHKGGGTSIRVKDRRLFYSRRSAIIYSQLHFSLFSAQVVSFCILIVEPFIRLLYCIGSVNFDSIPQLLRGYKYLWKWLFTRIKENIRINAR